MTAMSLHDLSILVTMAEDVDHMADKPLYANGFIILYWIIWVWSFQYFPVSVASYCCLFSF